MGVSRFLKKKPSNFPSGRPYHKKHDNNSPQHRHDTSKYNIAAISAPPPTPIVHISLSDRKPKIAAKPAKNAQFMKKPTPKPNIPSPTHNIHAEEWPQEPFWGSGWVDGVLLPNPTPTPTRRIIRYKFDRNGENPVPLFQYVANSTLDDILVAINPNFDPEPLDHPDDLDESWRKPHVWCRKEIFQLDDGWNEVHYRSGKDRCIYLIDEFDVDDDDEDEVDEFGIAY